MSKPAHIAVFGDVHGHLTLAYRLARRWERETGNTLDLVLQVGDLGCYPPPYHLDKATLRFSRKDPDELGFGRDYYDGSDEADQILGPEAAEEYRISADMVFIKGNHEDFGFLAEVSSGAREPVPVDAYQRIFYLPSGVVWQVDLSDQSLSIGALGGISDGGEAGTRAESQWYTREDVRHARKGGHTDILLTHEPHAGCVSQGESGSPQVRSLLQELTPIFHFCGHWHIPGQELESPGSTRSYILNEVNFHGNRPVNPGCMGVLTWAGPERASFEIIDEPWMREYRRESFRTL